MTPHGQIDGIKYTAHKYGTTFSFVCSCGGLQEGFISPKQKRVSVICMECNTKTVVWDRAP